MMIIGHCTNPDCHRPYAGGNYSEVITLRRLADGGLDYFVISICLRCLNSANDIIIAKSLREAVNYEIMQNAQSIVLTREQKIAYRQKHERYQFLGWGRNREELDDKLKEIL